MDVQQFPADSNAGPVRQTSMARAGHWHEILEKMRVEGDGLQPVRLEPVLMIGLSR